MTLEEKTMYDFAYTLIWKKGIEIRQKRSNTKLEAWEKTNQMDLTTEDDVYIQTTLIRSIKHRYPGHGIVAEEENLWIEADKQGYTWLMDPIDGTVNYYRFGRDYAISLALYQHNRPIFGMVYDVAKDTMYSSVQDEGVFINGTRFESVPKAQENLKDAVVAVSIRTISDLNNLGMDILKMLSKVQAHRYLGCASLELCMVAKGDYDLYISSNVYPWDVAAARIFLEQGGAYLLSDQKTKYDSPCSKLWVAAFRSPSIWAEAREYLSEDIGLGN